MTWGEFKAEVEKRLARGLRSPAEIEAMPIHYIDILGHYAPEEMNVYDHEDGRVGLRVS